MGNVLRRGASDASAFQALFPLGRTSPARQWSCSLRASELASAARQDGAPAGGQAGLGWRRGPCRWLAVGGAPCSCLTPCLTPHCTVVGPRRANLYVLGSRQHQQQLWAGGKGLSAAALPLGEPPACLPLTRSAALLVAVCGARAISGGYSFAVPCPSRWHRQQQHWGDCWRSDWWPRSGGR